MFLQFHDFECSTFNHSSDIAASSQSRTTWMNSKSHQTSRFTGSPRPHVMSAFSQSIWNRSIGVVHKCAKRYTDRKRVYFCLGFFSRVQHLSLKQVMHSYCQHYLGSRKRNYKNFFRTMWSSYTKNIELSNVNDTATGHRQPLAKPTILYISLLLGAQIFLQCFFFFCSWPGGILRLPTLDNIKTRARFGLAAMW